MHPGVAALMGFKLLIKFGAFLQYNKNLESLYYLTLSCWLSSSYITFTPDKYQIMKQIALLLLAGSATFAQSVIGQNNSGSLVTSTYSAGVGVIYVVPQNPDHASAGTLAILTQIVQLNLGINDYAIANGVTYYPNPVQNYLTIDVKQNINLAHVQVFDAKGAAVTLPAVNGNTLNLTSLQAGIYFISFPNTNIKPIKIVKN